MKPWVIDAATFLEHSEFSNIEKDDLILWRHYGVGFCKPKSVHINDYIAK